MSTSTTAKDASPIGSVVAVVILVGSLLLNFYLLRRPGSAQATASFSEPAKTKSAVATKPGAKPLETTAIADEADLETLRDTLLAAGASENRVREVIWGTLRWRFREEQSKKRLARMERGWWKDEQRTIGITNARRLEPEDPALLRELVDDEMAAMMGPDPTEVAVAKARYSFLPEDLQAQFGKMDREAPPAYMRTGDAEADARAEAEVAQKLIEARRERDRLIASLGPDQRREWDMHYGRLASQLVNDMRNVSGSTEEEYRKIYRIAEEMTASLNEPAVAAGTGIRPVSLVNGAISMDGVRPFMDQPQQDVVNRMVSELGYERALDYVWASSQEYRAVSAVAQEGSLPSTTAARFTQLAAETGYNAAAIHRDGSLTVDQKRAALLALQQTANTQVGALMPPEVLQKMPPASVQWLTQLGEGRYRLISPSYPGRTGGATYTGSVANPSVALPPQLFTPPPTRPAGL